tara:strand:- start:522 stop:818 length:297 start_codon:yes stop_codon:yes gene_type:complete
MKKNLDSLIEQALDNINKDRQMTELLLESLRDYMSVSLDRYSDSGPVAAKFVETLQRSNEQLVKLAALVHKQESMTKNNGLSESDKDQLFDLLNDQDG